MSGVQGPKIDPRRTREFTSDLLARARTWLPNWGLTDDKQDFGRALLEIAARFSSEVAERLDRGGDKMARGLLDWLAIRGMAARPARMPVVFKLADNTFAVDAMAPVKLQLDADGTPIVLETETDVRLVPGQLELVVGVDPDKDAYYLPPPGLSSLDPIEPLPTAWQLKSFASPNTNFLQLDPALGLAVGMLLEIQGLQFRIVEVKGDIVTIEPPVPPGEGFAPTTALVKKVSTFAPFDLGARNRQFHALYLGDSDLLNIESEALIEVVGAGPLDTAVDWEYWGKGDDDTPRWRSLQKIDPVSPDAIALKKPKGAIEPKLVGTLESRWIRASCLTVKTTTPLSISDRLALRINCTDNDEPAAATSVVAMANTTPLELNNIFFPLGRAPRQFDAFYLSCNEAFSKPGAQVHLRLDLAELSIESLAHLRFGDKNQLLAGVASDGYLHLLHFDAASGRLSRLQGRAPLRPPSPVASPPVSLDAHPPFQPAAWLKSNEYFNEYFFAVSAGASVWLWDEIDPLGQKSGINQKKSGWTFLGEVGPVEEVQTPINGLVYLSEEESGAGKLFALRDSKLFVRDPNNVNDKWQLVPVTYKFNSKNTRNELELKRIVPIEIIKAYDHLDTGRLDVGLLGVSNDNYLYAINFEGTPLAGSCTELLPNVTLGIAPAGIQRIIEKEQSKELIAVAVSKNEDHLCSYSSTTPLSAKTVPLKAPIVGQSIDVNLIFDELVFALCLQPDAQSTALAWWTPYPRQLRQTDTLQTATLPDGIGSAAGTPTLLAKHHVVIPGAPSQLLVAEFVQGRTESTTRLVLSADTQSILDKIEVANWSTQLGDTSSNPDLSWEYWNGTGWWKLANVDDETFNLKRSGTIRLTVPDDLYATDWSGQTSHWVRARLVGGDYGQARTFVIIKEDKKDNRVSEQTIEQLSDSVRAPQILRLHVYYAACSDVLPAYVVTEDSGGLRNQSDANRTSGALVTAFTPISLGLPSSSTEADSPPTSQEPSSDGDCLCDACSTTHEAAGFEAHPAAETVIAGSGRAIYLGFSAKLVGQPVNVLCVVDQERPHDSFAPLRIEALIGNHFVPVISTDTTRALGETGLLSMSFPVPPVEAELFGHSLSWLRLTPSRQSVDAEWQPRLLGVYFNAVWARAAETMTRELVGSSEGAPNLTLQLARPPLLHDTLELRVREPLGEEERAALRVTDPQRVLSEVENLPGDWVRWYPVVDPADCGPGDRVYALDETTGTLTFGDGLHGMIPPTGRDAIVAFSYQRSELGPGLVDSVPANTIAPRTVLGLVSPVEGVEAVFAADHAAGGATPDSSERVQRFSPSRLWHRGRVLTLRDFEDMALQSSSNFVQARCFAHRTGLRLVVAMRGAQPLPNQAVCRELRHTLLEAASAQLALPKALQVLGPTVRYLRIALVLQVASLEVSGSLARYVKRTLHMFFDTATGSATQDGWSIGAAPSEDDIALALLDAPGLESIGTIEFSEINTDGKASIWRHEVRPHELVILADDAVRIDFRLMETE